MPSPNHFTPEEVQALRLLAARELARQQELQREVEQRAVAVARLEHERAEAERWARARNDIWAAGPSHGAVSDGIGCVCKSCLKLREQNLPAFKGWSADAR